MDGSPVSQNQRTALQSILTGTGRWSMRLLGPALLVLGASEASAQPPAQVHQRTQPINYVGRFLGIGYSDGYHTCRSNPLPRPSYLLEGNINATAGRMLQQSYPATPCASGNCSPQTMAQPYAPAGYYPPATMYQPTAPPQSGFPWQGGSNLGSSGMSGPTPAMPRQPQLPPSAQPQTKRQPPAVQAAPEEDASPSDRSSSDRSSSDRPSSAPPLGELADPLMDAPSLSDSPGDDSEGLLPEEAGSDMPIPAAPDLGEPDLFEPNLGEPDLGESEMSNESAPAPLEEAPGEEAPGEEASEDLLPAPGEKASEPASEEEDLLTLRRAQARGMISSSTRAGQRNVPPKDRTAMRSVVASQSQPYQARPTPAPPRVASPAARMMIADARKWELPPPSMPRGVDSPLSQPALPQEMPLPRVATMPGRRAASSSSAPLPVERPLTRQSATATFQR